MDAKVGLSSVGSEEIQEIYPYSFSITEKIFFGGRGSVPTKEIQEKCFFFPNVSKLKCIRRKIFFFEK